MNATASLPCSRSFSGFLVLLSLSQGQQGGPGPGPNFWLISCPSPSHWLSSRHTEFLLTLYGTKLHPTPQLYISCSLSWNIFCPSLAPPSLVSYSSFRPSRTITSSDRPSLTCQAGFGSPIVQSQLLMLFHHGTYQSCDSVAFGLILV